MAEWYVISPGGEAVGPVSEDLIIKGVLGGKVPAEALVARVGEGDWLPLVSVPDFAKAIRQIAPPVPPPPPPPTAQEGAWYASVQGEILGPFAQSEIINSISLGKFPTNILVCRVGESSWRSLEDEGVFKPLADKIASDLSKKATQDHHFPINGSEATTSASKIPEKKLAEDPYGLTLVMLPAAAGILSLIFSMELLGFFMLVVVVLSGIVVALDLRKWKLPFSHAVATFLLWIFAVPYHLHLRAKIGAPRLVWKWVAAVSFCFLTPVMATLVDAELPACTAPEVTSAAQKAIKDKYIYITDMSVVITSPGEFKYDPAFPSRVCRGMLYVSFKENHDLKFPSVLYYKVTWHNKIKGEIWVETLGEVNER